MKYYENVFFTLIFISYMTQLDATSCTFDSQCHFGMKCCAGECRYDCLGYHCNTKPDCSSNEVCCSNKCQYSWNDCSCVTLFDCPGSQLCCSGTCKNSCGYSDGAVAGIVIGSLALIALVVFGILIFCGCVYAVGPFRSRSRGRVITGQNYGTTTTTVVTGTTVAPTPTAPPLYGSDPQYPQGHGPMGAPPPYKA